MGVINNIKVGFTNYDISIPYGTCTTTVNTSETGAHTHNVKMTK